MAALAALGAFSECALAHASIDLDDIPTRPVAPQFSVGRFFQTNDLFGLEFSPDNRTLYFVRILNAMGSDGFRLWKYRIGAPLPKLAKSPMPYFLESLSLQAGGRIAVVRYRSRLASRTAIFVDDFAKQSTFGLAKEVIAGAVFSRSDPKIGVIITADAAMPRRYWLLGSEGPQLLYDTNQSGIDNGHFAQSRSLLVPSFDGLQVPVHLFVPNGTSKESPRPAIFLIHGGPQEHIDPEFDSRIQFLANRGFIVVTPNVRGSTGLGKRYAMLDDGDWGGGHVKDIVEVAGFVRALDFVDRDNLFVLGESFGGFSVLSLITQYPGIFRAAVSISGMAELADFVDSWPAYAHSYVLLELGFDPRRDPQRNRAISPLYQLHRIRMPLQIHQGRNDRRVPKGQIDRLVARLRSLGLSVEYHVYQDEGHGFLRSPNEQAAFSRIIAFFRRHVR
jgi:dipeptidyl aminopeptidase/acylaminoacyl peptidase